MKRFKKTVVFLLVTLMVFTLAASASAEDTRTFKDIGATKNDIVVLYTNDVHGGVSNRALINGTSENCLGYAGIAAIRKEASDQAGAALLVDVGDSIQGSAIDTDTKGKNSVDLMVKLGYDICVPGNHEFDWGVKSFLDLASASGLNYLCCNFTDMSGNLLFPRAYDIKTFTINGKTVKIGFVGIDTPESIAKGTPAFFQDESGNFIYSLHGTPLEDLYGLIQTSIDTCKTEGADYVLLLGHMGDDGIADPGWTSKSIIANTSGAGVFLDGHAHSVIPGEVLKNKDGQDVILSSTGSKLNYLGALRLSVAADGTITPSTALINRLTDEEKAMQAFKDMDAEVKKVEDTYAYLEEIEGTTGFDLRISDKETGDRLVRKQDTNMGDFLTDGYLWYANNDPDFKGFKKADAAVLNGGSIRSNIAAGDIRFGHILAVMPWATHVTEIVTTGQHILECLEMGARLLPEKECGGFMVGGGLSYMIDVEKESKVVTDENGMFVKVDGSYDKGDFRVHSVKIGGENIDPARKYVLVINAYYSEESGDGMTMFKDDERIISGSDNVIDTDVIVKFLKEGLKGSVPDQYADQNGDGRIKLAKSPENFPQTGVTEKTPYIGLILLVIASALTAAAAIIRKKQLER